MRSLSPGEQMAVIGMRIIATAAATIAAAFMAGGWHARRVLTTPELALETVR